LIVFPPWGLASFISFFWNQDMATGTVN